MTTGGEIVADIALDCPRCGTAVTERFHGPCASCRAELRSAQTGTRSAVEADEYEPKMNVTPNAVASKE
jgi:hypothetical protein